MHHSSWRRIQTECQFRVILPASIALCKAAADYQYFWMRNIWSQSVFETSGATPCGTQFRQDASPGPPQSAGVPVCQGPGPARYLVAQGRPAPCPSCGMAWSRLLSFLWDGMVPPLVLPVGWHGVLQPCLVCYRGIFLVIK